MIKVDTRTGGYIERVQIDGKTEFFKNSVFAYMPPYFGELLQERVEKYAPRQESMQ